MILWSILIIVLIIVGSMWFRKFLQGVKKVQAAQKVVDKEMEEIERLSLLEAETRAQSLLQEALTREWTEPPSLEIDARLSLLDASVSKLLRKFRTIRFDPSETEISADFLLNADLPDDLWMIGLNRRADQRKARL